MDRRVAPSRWRRYAPYLGAAVAVLVIGALWFNRPATGSVQSVAGDRLVVEEVKRGVFEDFIPARGRVEPARTVYLDAVEGGRVEAVHVLDGAEVAEDDLLIELSNTQLQLDVISREAEVAGQLNELRNIELRIEQNRLDHARNLNELEYQIATTRRRIGRQEELLERAATPEAELLDARDELAYLERAREITIEARDTDERLMRAQMEQLRDSSDRLERNLELARGNLDNLSVRAPVAGVLTALDAEIGQSLSRGQRVGQIDSPNAFKLSASLDEYYLPRVAIGLRANAEIDGAPYELRISRIVPQVENGQFTAELQFEGDAPESLRRGQSISLRLYLGEAEEALVLPAGAFLAQTGGNWAFVLNADGSAAERRSIRTGRRNSGEVEVLEGLSPGEQVVVSSYEPFGDVDRLELN